MKIYKISQFSDEYQSNYFDRVDSDLPLVEISRLRNDLIDGVENLKRDIFIPENTCPLIDSVIKSVGEAVKSAEAMSKSDTIEEAKAYADEISSSLWFVEGHMEDIRSANKDLRRSGSEWYNKTKEMLGDLENFLNIL